MSEPECVCPLAGWCERYQRVQAERDLHFCRGSGPADLPPVSHRQQAHYRAQWVKAMQGQEPGTVRKLRNAAQAAKRAACNRMLRVPLEVVAERRAHCDTCELRDPEKDRCTHKKCGCPLSSKRVLLGTATRPGKLELAGESCPLGLWGAWESPPG